MGPPTRSTLFTFSLLTKCSLSFLGMLISTCEQVQHSLTPCANNITELCLDRVALKDRLSTSLGFKDREDSKTLAQQL